MKLDWTLGKGARAQLDLRRRADVIYGGRMKFPITFEEKNKAGEGTGRDDCAATCRVASARQQPGTVKVRRYSPRAGEVISLSLI